MRTLVVVGAEAPRHLVARLAARGHDVVVRTAATAFDGGVADFDLALLQGGADEVRGLAAAFVARGCEALLFVAGEPEATSALDGLRASGVTGFVAITGAACDFSLACAERAGRERVARDEAIDQPRGVGALDVRPDLDSAVDLAPNEARHRILIVDDEPRLAVTLKMLLRDHEVEVADGGRRALERIDRDRSFDVLLCDLMMVDVDGVDMYERVRARAPGLEQRIIFMTGGAFTPRASAFLASIPNVCLEKPFAVEELLRAMRRTLDHVASA